MKKMIFCFCLFFSFALFGESWTSYSDLKEGFTIEYPKNWDKVERQGTIDLILTSPQNKQGGSEATVNIIAQNLPQDIDLTSFYTFNLKKLLESNDSVRLDDSCPVKIDGREAKVLRYTMDQGTPVKIIQYLLVKDQRGYVVTTGAALESFPKYQELLEKMAKSFKIRKGE